MLRPFKIITQYKSNRSISKTEIKLDQPAIEAFEKLKLLLQENIELCQPDFNKFELTTDASNFAIGAVLSQDRHILLSFHEP